MVQIQTNEVNKGSYIIYNGDPHQVVDKEFVNPGKGVAFTRFKLRSLRTGNTVTATIKSGELIETYDVFAKDMQLLYRENNDFVFMDPDTFEQTTVPADVIGAAGDFLKEGDAYTVLQHDNQGVGIKPPRRVVLEVTEAPPSARGNTATNLTKQVVLENGVTISAPAFVDTGDKIAVDPETRSYIERVKA